MRAMTGTGRERIASHARWVQVCSSFAPRAVRSFISAMSAPAMNDRSPAPVRTATRSSLSAASCRNACASCRLPAMPRALRFSGLLTVTYAMRPASRGSTRPVTSHGAFESRPTNHSPRSVTPSWIDAVPQRFAPEKTLEVLEPEIEQSVDVARVVAAHVRHDDEIGGIPQRRVGGERLGLEHVEHGAGKRALRELLAQGVVIH